MAPEHTQSFFLYLDGQEQRGRAHLDGGEALQDTLAGLEDTTEPVHVEHRLRLNRIADIVAGERDRYQNFCQERGFDPRPPGSAGSHAVETGFLPYTQWTPDAEDASGHEPHDVAADSEDPDETRIHEAYVREHACHFLAARLARRIAANRLSLASADDAQSLSHYARRFLTTDEAAEMTEQLLGDAEMEGWDVAGIDARYLRWRAENLLAETPNALRRGE